MVPRNEPAGDAVRPLVSVGYYPTQDTRATIDLARELDGGIVDTLWVGDSPLIWRECWTSIALCLAATETLRFGPAVTNPVNRHWTVTASTVQTLDEYAPGRVRLGIGVGDSALRRLNGGVARLAELRSAVHGMRTLLADGAADTGAADTGAADTGAADTGAADTGPDGPEVSWDRPPRQVEILLSGSGPKTLELAGELGDGAIIVPGIVPAAVDQVLERVAAGRRAAGRDPSTLHSVLWVACAIGEEEQAWADVRPWVASILRHPLAFDTSPEVDAARERIRSAYDFSHHMSHGSGHGEELPVEVLRDFAIAGTEEQVLAGLNAAARLPVDELGLVVMGRDVHDQVARLNKLLNDSWLT
ncbi:5%2C10-methylenetetrahydromethanopterin reductase [Mycobacterium tuberculosis]|nr:5%2C10-methylenetetrahydromethanopterin reductase [Mycobacterium tuberculosis]